MKPKARGAKPAPIEVPIGVITAITASPRAVGRFDVVIDQTPAARLSIQGIERLGLGIGLVVDETLAGAIAHEATISRAYDRAMMMLAARGRASGELRRLLIQKGEDKVVVSTVIERLTTAGFLDDEAFARQFTRAKAAGGSMSRRRIEQELGKRGIARADATDAVAETFADEQIDESANILRVAEKKLRTLDRVDDLTRRRRLYGYLARRGYGIEAINEVVGQLVRNSGKSAESAED